tara:strand:+ start:883 stop:1467 length:585 start_codon:yes stop_codon:yes gene_type:complete
MQSDEIINMFKQNSALLEGHFILSSGLHTSGYLQCALVLQHPEKAAQLGSDLASRVKQLAPTLILSPALGGLIIGHEVARACGTRAIFAERKNGVLTLRRGFTIEKGERVLVVEDVVTTGGSTRETIAVAKEFGVHVVGAAAVINRGDTKNRFDVPFEFLASVSWPIYSPQSCPLCEEGLPLVKPGSRNMPSTG